MEADIDKQTVIFESSDGEKVEICVKAAKKSGTAEGVLRDYADLTEKKDTLKLMNVNGKTMKKIVEYLLHYQNENPPEIEKPLKKQNFKDCVPEWDYNFIDVELDVIFEIILGANYMNIQSLLDLGTAKVASIIRDKKTEEMRKMFNITETGFTDEELKEIEEESKYCEESF